ncbi:NADH-quinone oxidoreductase subunit M [Anaplasma capra]|uniref:complex I subunit 4 family protein n=1 Tax=Anaplasma capra TaxID=1562740 RepID=UPI0021D5DA72|nr:NADH-quinone oxidoreductase subunit M [Anaplasma capra]MCU7611589.1 NADH-quinone oxidoreductase subunit M [Anaplasma capra]
MIFLMILIPVLGSCAVASMRGTLSRAVGPASVAVTLAVLCVGIALLVYGNHCVIGGGAYLALVERAFSADALSTPLIVLSALLFFICALFSVFGPRGGAPSSPAFFALLLLLEALVVAVFSVCDVLLFYVFFEASLIPMFFMIGFWGHGDKVGAAFKFLIYTATASLVFLAALVCMNAIIAVPLGSFDSVAASLATNTNFHWQMYFWIACLFAFAVKLPMVPFHTWLPSAHVQAPTVGSVLLAGLLIKLGGYGILRFCVQMLPAVSTHFAKFVVCLSAVSLIYSSLVAFAQRNMKMLVAYSSIAHMSFVSAGVFSLNEAGILGAIFQMLSHGLISAALFLCVGMIYSRTGTMEMSECGGLASSMPRLSVMMIFFSMASAGIPGTSGFMGEFLSMLGIFKSYGPMVALFVVGMVLSAAYMLRLCREVVWGTVPSEAKDEFDDITVWEFAVLIVLAVLVLVLGVFPAPLLALLKPGVEHLLVHMHMLQPSWG